MQRVIAEEANRPRILACAVLPVILTWALIPLSFLIPLIDSTRPPYFDLSNDQINLIYWLSESGGKFGAPIVALLMLAILASRRNISLLRRGKETLIVVLVAGLFAGGGAFVNEHLIKAQLKVPRPNITWLATEHDALGMTAQEFYALGDKEDRRGSLSRILQAEPKPLALSPSIEAHWIEETGYSFPSGHAFSAMFFAAFLLSLGVTYLHTKRLLCLYFLLPWALAICYSRPILRVHTPVDISVGGLLGICLGFTAWAIVCTLNRRFS